MKKISREIAYTKVYRTLFNKAKRIGDAIRYIEKNKLQYKEGSSVRLGDSEFNSFYEIQEAYGYGQITSRQMDKLIEELDSKLKGETTGQYDILKMELKLLNYLIARLEDVEDEVKNNE